jgi:hypothetical protein
MWTYNVSNGNLTRDGLLVGTGYSGHGPGLNNPAMQSFTDVGPIPAGLWSIGEAYTIPGKGPLVMRLTPDETTNVFGRSGFMIHGDSIEAPGAEEASLGCIIMPRSVRQAVADSGDTELNVV